MSNEDKEQKPENPLLSLLVNIIIPTIVLMKFSDESALGPQVGLIAAIAFPIVYGLWELIGRRKVNYISVLGVVSIFLTGGIGLLKLDAHWIAVKEAAVPVIIGLAILVSLKTKSPLIRTFLYNGKVMNLELVNERLRQRGHEADFDKLLTKGSLLLSLSFFLSGVLNYGLAKVILVSPPGSAAFNQELGKMTGLSYPVIVLPSMIVMLAALWMLVKGIQSLTGLPLEQVLNGEKKSKSH